MTGPLKLLAEKQAAHPIGDEICIGSVFFSHDGSNVISVGRSDGTLKVWGLRPFEEAEWEEKHGLFPIDEETSLDPKPISYWENIVTGDLRRVRSSCGACAEGLYELKQLAFFYLFRPALSIRVIRDRFTRID